MSAKTELAQGFTVGDYRQAVKDEDREAIAAAIHRRFRQRYLTSITGTTKHGFTMMAGACLTIEALESFRQGWTRTDKKGRSPETFRLFFDASDSFKAFRGRDFYFQARWFPRLRWFTLRPPARSVGGTASKTVTCAASPPFTKMLGSRPARR